MPYTLTSRGYSSTARKTLITDSLGAWSQPPALRPTVEEEPETWELRTVLGYLWGEWVKIPERERLRCPTLMEHLLEEG